MTIKHVLTQSYLINTPLAEEIEQCGKIKTLRKGSYLFTQDETVNYLALPLDGVLGVHAQNSYSDDLYYNIVTPGIVLNELSYLLGAPAASEVRAATDCRVLLLDFEDAKYLESQHTDFIRMFATSLAKKQQLLQQLLFLRSEKESAAKVEKALNLLMPFAQNGTLTMTNQTLAALLGMSRNTVGSAISQMASLGKVQRQASGFTLVSS